MKKLAYINLETSGLDRKKDEIIRFTTIVIGGDKKSKIFDKYAKPRTPLSKGAEIVTGITNAELENCETFESVKAEFVALIDGATVVGYNLDCEEEMLGVHFADKIEIDQKKQANDVDFENAFREIRMLAKQEKLSIIFVQKALKCGYPAARKIVDAFNYPSQRVNFNKNIFDMDKLEQANYLESLVADKYTDFGYDIADLYPRLELELERIKELDLVTEFLVAKSVAEILRDIEDKPYFFSIRCCSLVAYIIGITTSTEKMGITSEDLDPIAHGLIFECGFPKNLKSKSVFCFFVEDNILKQLIDKLVQLYGENVTVTADADDEEFLELSINGTGVRILKKINRMHDIYLSTGTAIADSQVGIFIEDYMNLLHFIGGFKYEEANEIRRKASKIKKTELEIYRKNFVTNSWYNMPYLETNRLFDKILEGIKTAHYKALYLCVKQILENQVLPF